ncbi:MAG: polyphosphate:AMP phosphotransferase, partial [Gammaproteobacteria bacterium]
MPNHERDSMFQPPEPAPEVSKEDYDAQIDKLNVRLLAARRKLKEKGIPTVLIVSGIEGGDRADVVKRLNEWLDPRSIETHAFWDATEEALERPANWRYWQALPARGEIAVLFDSWYTAPLDKRLLEKCSGKELKHQLQRIVEFERLLVDDGMLIAKFWFHVPEDDQRKRLKKLADDPGWKYAPTRKVYSRRYDRYMDAAAQVGAITDLPKAPWRVINAANRRRRDLSVASELISIFEQRLRSRARAKKTGRRARVTAKPMLDKVDLDQALSPQEYQQALDKYQGRLGELAWQAYKKKRATVLVFQGWDAAGKGGAIRRLLKHVDPRLYRVISVAAPNDEELAHHYLWRFWRRMPRAGYMTIFDRSWYGRVLVEKIEGFATPEQVERAYDEIRAFERELLEGGIVLVKFWLHIDADEQLRRFKARAKTPHKKHKITDEDWRNREKWSAYEDAVNEMIERTSNGGAPWTLVAANDKRFARVQVLKTVCNRL